MNATEGQMKPEIDIMAFTEKGRTVIQVKDNGAGMNEDVASNIFVLFFTTKAKGSGIGLSLSKQVMRLHSGSISRSEPGKGSIFT